MKQKTNAIFMIAMSICIAFIACNQPAKTDESAKVNTTTGTAKTETMPAYDPVMDPVKVEAAFVKLLADTLGVKLYEGVYQPGDTIGIHTHPDNIIYVLGGSTVEITNADGTSQTVEFKAGMGFVGGPVTHKAKITGTTPLRLLVTDIYRPRN